MLTLADRSKMLLDTSLFKRASPVINTLPYAASRLDIPEDQYVLRMLVKSPDSNGLHIPDELRWLHRVIAECMIFQMQLGQDHPYVYVTVRSGIVRSTTDDEWHVDGFSMRVPHVPEQNYVWTDVYPTEHLKQQFTIPDDFDPLKHNIHNYFQDNADLSNVVAMPAEHLSRIDPYIVHRRPAVPVGVRRTFFRISFVPIQIEDDLNTQNPLLPVAPFHNTDIRTRLTRYK